MTSEGDGGAEGDPRIRTPDRRVRVFVSSTLSELAAERAAARTAITRLLTPATLLRRLGAGLDRSLDLAASAVDTPDRQRTLRAPIDWSYSLLGGAERALLTRGKAQRDSPALGTQGQRACDRPVLTHRGSWLGPVRRAREGCGQGTLRACPLARSSCRHAGDAQVVVLRSHRAAILPTSPHRFLLQ